MITDKCTYEIGEKVQIVSALENNGFVSQNMRTRNFSNDLIYFFDIIWQIFQYPQVNLYR